jgi:hypothetical protein
MQNKEIFLAETGAKRKNGKIITRRRKRSGIKAKTVVGRDDSRLC